MDDACRRYLVSRAEEVNCMAAIHAMKLSGKRTVCGHNSEKPIHLAPKEQYPMPMSAG